MERNKDEHRHGDKEKVRRASRIAKDDNEDGMFRELNKVNTPLADKWRKAALLLSYLSVLVTLSLGVTYFVFSASAESSSAFALAFAAILDTATSVVVVWRFCGSSGEKYSVGKERRACVAIGTCFVLSSFLIAGKAVYTLIMDHEPRRDINLVITSAVSLVCLFNLAWSKYYVSYQVDSRAMKADAFNSTAGALMTFALIVSDVVYGENGSVWFLDAITAICIAFALFIYGLRSIIELSFTQGMTPVPRS